MCRSGLGAHKYRKGAHYKGQVKGIIWGSTELSDLFLSGELKNIIATNNNESVAELVYVLFCFRLCSSFYNTPHSHIKT